MAAGTTAGVWVLVLSLWGVAVSDQNITARIGKPLVLNCKGAPKKPPQQLEWKLGGPWDSVARVLPNGSLLLPAVGIQDEGTFRCRATSRNGKETKSNYRVQVYQIPGKPDIVDPASELMAGVPNKVGTCVSEGGYPAGTLSWHLDGKTLIPDGKGVSVKEETRRHPETGLFTLHSELMVTPAWGGAPQPTFSCSFSPSFPRRRALHTAPIRPSVWEPVPLEEVQLVVEPAGGAVPPGGTVTLTCETSVQPPPQIHWTKDVSDLEQGLGETGEEGPAAGSVEGPGLGTLALALGILGGLGTAALLVGVIMWHRRQRRGQERKAPENQEEDEEERAELNQPEDPEAAESSAGGP
uniref:Advanced glycosylation end product-specific receptor n=1 Tax=Sus scrofa TaxID=9823 RepID=A0A8D0QAJ6_PIG